jgi:hypothetical protein
LEHEVKTRFTAKIWPAASIVNGISARPFVHVTTSVMAASSDQQTPAIHRHNGIDVKTLDEVFAGDDGRCLCLLGAGTGMSTALRVVDV